MRGIAGIYVFLGFAGWTAGCGSSHDTTLHSGTANENQRVEGEERDADTPPPDASSADDNARRAAGNAAVLTGNGDLSDIQFEFQTNVPAGAELLRCIYAQMPTDRGVVAIDKIDSHYTPGSHHMLAYRSNLTSIPDGGEGVFDCSDGAWQLNERGSYYEAQQPDQHRELPQGIAHELQPGEVLIIQAHYINPNDTDIAAHVQLILHATDLASVQQEAGTIYFNDLNIQVPAHAKSREGMTCELPQDIDLALLWSHMHKRGVHFVATTDDEDAAQALGTLYEEHDWSEPKERVYPSDPPVVLHRGTHIHFACEYQNDGDTDLVFGNSAENNEMCILHGMYWPRMPAFFEQCILGRTETATR
jgi:hypothetical protein